MIVTNISQGEGLGKSDNTYTIVRFRCMDTYDQLPTFHRNDG